MAFFSELVRAVAHAEGIEEMTVTGIGQYLRDAELIRKGGRGLSAAKMSARDGANLLIGLNGSMLAKHAVSAVSDFRSLRADEYRYGFENAPFNGEYKLPEDFGSALECLIEWCGADPSSGNKIDKLLISETAKSLKPRHRKIIDRKGFKVLPARLEIEFCKPLATSSIKIFSPIMDHSFEKTFLVGSVAMKFVDPSADESKADRTDVTIITDQTIRSVAEAIYN